MYTCNSFQRNSKKFKEIQRNSKKFKEIQRIQRNSKKFKEIQGNSKKFKEIQRNSKEFIRNSNEIQKNSKKFKGIHKKFKRNSKKFIGNATIVRKMSQKIIYEQFYEFYMSARAPASFPSSNTEEGRGAIPSLILRWVPLSARRTKPVGIAPAAEIFPVVFWHKGRPDITPAGPYSDRALPGMTRSCWRPQMGRVWLSVRQHNLQRTQMTRAWVSSACPSGPPVSRVP
jgi:hypothetical protein